MPTKDTKSRKPKRKTPISIPLPFEKAVDGLLKVKPSKPTKKAKKK